MTCKMGQWDPTPRLLLQPGDRPECVESCEVRTYLTIASSFEPPAAFP